MEVGLRSFYPGYEQAAEAQFQHDSLRISTRPPNTRRTAHHPDTGKEHLVIYNNHGMRQHRNFVDPELQNSVNVGFFGDSYMENEALPGPYSFTEPLDYLLNLGDRRFNVLNFGHSGYGTGQSFLAYRYSSLAENLEHVFYVFCVNDIRNIYENDLFYLDANGKLQRNPVLESPWWIRFASRLHLTYLVQDGYNRLFPRKNEWEGFDARIFQEKHADKYVRKRVRSDRARSVEEDLKKQKDNDDVVRSLAIFRTILKDWKNLAEANGARFSIVLLPTGQEQVIKAFIDDSFHVIDLHEIFGNQVTNFDYADWHFENDWHWAEAANRLAASSFYKDIAKETDIEPMSDEQIDQALYTYYSAFEYGWLPADPDPAIQTTAAEQARIVKKYATLELPGDDNADN